MIKPTLVPKTSLQHTLTPQQIQYLKLLQLPLVSLEQAIIQEIELNPFLEEVRDDDDGILEFQQGIDAPAPDQDTTIPDDDYIYDEERSSNKETASLDNIDNVNNTMFTDEVKLNKLEDGDSYDQYSYQWEDDGDFNPRATTDEDNDFEPFQIKDEISFYDDLISQTRLLELSDEENLFALHVIGNIDEDGYLRRPLEEIINETNSIIAKHNFDIQKRQYEQVTNFTKDSSINPAKKFELSAQSVDILKAAIDTMPEIQKQLDSNSSRRILDKFQNIDTKEKILSHITPETANYVLKLVQKLDPPGIASRNVQECLTAQLKAKPKLNSDQKLALLILTEGFEEFSKKHFDQIQKKFEVTRDQVREAFEEIKKLNPKPGGNDFNAQTNTIIPDFLVKYSEEIDDLMITLNDSTIPHIKVSSTYDKIKEEAKHNKSFNRETKEWIKDRYENAKFFIQAIKQRNITMLIIMTAIVERQRDFFMDDIKNLKPLIYKDIADDTGFDISTVCRIVNSKYVYTSMGTYELKFFFSEALPNDDGEEISTTVIKDKIKEIIANESKSKPYSDDQLTKLLKDEGYNVARRTVAKYRETLKIPVARLRKEI